MDEFFAAQSAGNDKLVCIGPLARKEAAEAVDAGLGEGLGLYIYVTSASSGGEAIDVLAKVANQDAAEVISRLLGFNASQNPE